jgi:hypothetical protein
METTWPQSYSLAIAVVLSPVYSCYLEMCLHVTILSKWILEKRDARLWSGFIWPRISWLAGRLLASQEEVSYVIVISNDAYDQLLRHVLAHELRVAEERLHVCRIGRSIPFTHIHSACPLLNFRVLCVKCKLNIYENINTRLEVNADILGRRDEIKIGFVKKLRADLIAIMLATIHFRIFCLRTCDRKTSD